MAGFYLMAASALNELIESYKEINFVYNETDSKAANKLMANDSYHCSKVFRQQCVKSVQIQSFLWSVFSIFCLSMGKYGPEKTLYWDTFHAVQFS